MAVQSFLPNIWEARQEMSGTKQPGWRLNNLTTTQRDALTGPNAAKAGDLIHNTTNGRDEQYDGTSWVSMLKRPIVADATGPVILTADQCGALCVFDKTDGAIFTLPAAAAGLWFEFVVAVASSSNAHRVNCASGDFILGSVMLHATDDTGLSSAAAANGSTHLAINLDADAVGRLAGSKFKLTAISGTQWAIEGDLLATGTVATPFETS